MAFSRSDEVGTDVSQITSDKVWPVTDSLSGACGEFLAALPQFREHFDASGKAFVSAEEKYLREQHNQARIQAEAQRIE
jgi:hypothetical protein